MRLNRYIAASTKYSRRQADELIKANKIQVNGQPMTDLSYQVKADDVVLLDNKKLYNRNKVYYVLNKPVGFVTSTFDPHATRLVIDLVPEDPPVFPVGRLDKDSQGLLLLTNDGKLAQELIHPNNEHEKEYLVQLDKSINEKDHKLLSRGVELDEGRARFDIIKPVKNNIYRIIIHQGWNRQIRRMFEKLNYQVLDLTRVRIAGIKLGSLPPGKYVSITPEKIIELIK